MSKINDTYFSVEIMTKDKNGNMVRNPISDKMSVTNDTVYKLYFLRGVNDESLRKATNYVMHMVNVKIDNIIMNHKLIESIKRT